MEENGAIEEVALKLSHAFGVRLIATSEIQDGGEFDALRLADLEVGPGFCVLIARTPKQVEASFRADNFAGGLVRQLSEATFAAREVFYAAVERAKADGLTVNLSVNGDDMEAMWQSADGWRRVEIDVCVRIPHGSDVAAAKIACASACLAAVFALLAPEDDDGVIGELEGASVRATATKYERSPVNRAACIEHFGCSCYACGFDFSLAYGTLGAGFIEVHHLTPVSDLGGPVRVDPRRDLVPLCSNCHSMVHRQDPPISPQDLRESLASRMSVDAGSAGRH